MKTQDLEIEAAEIFRHTGVVEFAQSITTTDQMIAIARSMGLECVFWKHSGIFEMRRNIRASRENPDVLPVWPMEWA